MVLLGMLTAEHFGLEVGGHGWPEDSVSSLSSTTRPSYNISLLKKKKLLNFFFFYKINIYYPLVISD